MRIAESPTIKEKYPLAGILTNFKTRKTSDWLEATSAEDISALELMIKTRYGERHLNSMGQLLAETPSNINGISDMLWVLHSGAWAHLWEDYVSEYNPIWNVDGTEVEEEERDLTQTHTGTDTTADSGRDTLTQTGTDTMVRSGTDTTAHTGTETLAQGGTVDRVKEGADTTTHTGTDTNVKTGTDTLVRSGSESNVRTGSQENTHDGTNTNENKLYGFDSAQAVPTSTQVQTPDTTDTLTYNQVTDTRTENNLTDTRTYGNLQDQATKNLTDEVSYDSGETETRNTLDTTTHNTQVQETKNLQDQETKNLTNQTQYGKTTQLTRQLSDTDAGTVTRTRTRHGNIGVTMSSQMLRDDTEYWSDIKALFYENVVKDIIGDICYRIYVES